MVLAQVTVELDAVYLPTATRSHQEQARWPQSLRRLGVQPRLLNGLHVGGGVAVTRAKRAAVALLFASPAPMALIETEVMQHLPDNSAAGPVRSVAARTRDVLEAVATICRVHGATFVDENRVSQMGVRLEIGLPGELGALAAELGTALTRAEYLSLLSHGISSADQIRSLSDEELFPLVGNQTAQRMRKVLEQADDNHLY
jgi:hypothetical protein